MNILTHLNEIEITNLCKNIDMPQDATATVLELMRTYDFSQVQPYFDLLFSYHTGNEAVAKINDLFKENENAGFLWLITSLSAALCTQEKYHEMRINDEIFYETMACLSRFVKEHKESFGVYGYDRQFWSYRQLSQTLYRIGTLEFEMLAHEGNDIVLDGETVLKKGGNIISVHIPSDARINSVNCHASYKMAIEFLEKYYPNFEFNLFYCHTWLLSPHLKEVLPESSNILQFQSDYTVCNVDEDDKGYHLWVFKERDIEPKDFKEDTSLQRNIKKHVLNGGKIGCAECIINKTKFL